MAEMKHWPYPLNQAGYAYPAQILRAQNYSATSGGNGVSSPESLKVVAQPAPDGTVQIRPGGADVVSTWEPGQSYKVHRFVPVTLPVPPTGSSGERHDLVIMRVLDPEFEAHPEHSGEIPAEVAAGLDFEWPEIIQNASASRQFDFPHVKLAQIRRPANTTIVTNDHIVDLRELSNPKTLLHMRANNLAMADAQSLHTGTSIWPEQATHTVKIPEFATRVQIQATWGTVRTHSDSGDYGAASGQVRVALVLDGQGTINTQQSTWRTPAGVSQHRFNIVLGDNRPIPAAFRGQDVRLELRGNKTYGPNVYMDGDSTWTVQLYFEQDID